MAKWGTDKTYLKINNNPLPVEPDKGYTITILDYEQVDETEAGTSVRNLVRTDIPFISVKFMCDKKMLKELREFKVSLSLDVYYFDPTVGVNEDNLKYALMYITNYSEVFKADTKDGGIWSVSFDLKFLDEVS